MAIFDLRYELLKAHSKVQCNKVIGWVGNDQKRFDELFDFFLNGESKITHLAAWPVSYCVIAHPELIRKHWSKLINYLQKDNLHGAIKRNSMRFMQEITIPKKYHGTVMNICFRLIESQTEKVAVKVFSMTVLNNLSKQYPDILPEIKLVIEEQLPYQTAAFISRAKKIIGKK